MVFIVHLAKTCLGSHDCMFCWVFFIVNINMSVIFCDMLLLHSCYIAMPIIVSSAHISWTSESKNDVSCHEGISSLGFIVGHTTNCIHWGFVPSIQHYDWTTTEFQHDIAQYLATISWHFISFTTRNQFLLVKQGSNYKTF